MALMPEYILKEFCARAVMMLKDKPLYVEQNLAAEMQFEPDIADRFNEFLQKTTRISTMLNWPLANIDSVPSVAVITMNSPESVAHTWLADAAGYEEVFAPIEVFGGGKDTDPTDLHTIGMLATVGTTYNASFNIVVTTKDGVMTLALTSLLSSLLFMAKHRMECNYGIQAQRLDEHDFRFPKDYFPLPTWSRAIRLTGLVQKLYPTEGLIGTEDDEDFWSYLIPTLSQINTDVTGVTTLLNKP